MKTPTTVLRAKHIFESDALLWLLLFTVGVSLRLFRLSYPPFWIDEIGVWQAAQQSTWQQALQIAKGHIMGMPLHYLQTWIAGQLGLQNEWLRLPDVIWGCLCIGVGYGVARYYIEKPAAVFAATLMTTSPLLIRYSQELRFYAGLYFFHLLLIFTSLRAFEKASWMHWLIVILSGIAGILFHPYTLLGIVFVFGYLLSKSEWISWQNLRRLLMVAVVLLGFFGWAIVQFGSVPAYQTPLFAFERPADFLLRGLGLAPIHSPMGMTPVYYVVLGLAFFGGLVMAIQNRNRQILLSLILAGGIIALILGMNAYRHYFVHSRQIYFLSFWVYLTAAYGLVHFTKGLLSRNYHPPAKMAVQKWLVSWMILIGLITMPALSQYFNAERTIVRSGSTALLEYWQPGDWICVIPDFDVIVLKTYWKNEVGQWLLPCDEREAVQNPQVQFVIAGENLNFSPRFREIYRPPADTFYPKVIWTRSD